KSTLLHVLAGRRPPEAGQVVVSPRTAHLGLLTQESDALEGETIRRSLARRTGVAEAEAEMDAAAQRLAEHPEDEATGAAYSAALEAWLALGGADLDERA